MHIRGGEVLNLLFCLGDGFLGIHLKIYYMPDVRTVGNFEPI